MQPDTTTTTQDFLDSARVAFERSPEQIRLWIVLGIVLIVLLVVVSVVSFLIIHRRRVAAAHRRFRGILMQHGLTGPDQALMERLEKYFQHDRSRLPELAHDPALFNAAAAKMREAEPETEEALARLRYKLKLIFRNAFQAPHSTTELTPGLPVYLTLNGKTEFDAMISDVQDHGFLIRSILPGRPGDEAAFELHSPAGIFRFRSRVKAVESGFFVFAHTENIEQTQKRRYYRQRSRLPVTIVREKTGGSAHTYALDLSGGGAKLHDPGLNLEENEALTVVVYFNRTESAAVAARVLRVDRKALTVSVVFESVNAALRDRLVRLAR